jgi:CheY-like chemotaxis protein
MLKDFKVKTDRACNGLIALKKVEERLNNKCCNQYYPLIIMDIDMPKMNGLECSH